MNDLSHWCWPGYLLAWQGFSPQTHGSGMIQTTAFGIDVDPRVPFVEDLGNVPDFFHNPI
jgi:hypothetical protein